MWSELPKGWSRTTLGEITTVKARIGWRGLSASEYTEDGPFLIAGKHIRSGVIDWAACDHLSTYRYDESPEIQMQAGDVIFSKDGSIGNPALIENLPGPATINGTMMMIRSHTEHLEPSYLYQVVCGADFHRMVREKLSGSSIPHIFQRDIVHFPVTLPPLDEQRRIAEVLRSVDEAIAANSALLDGVKATKQGTMEAVLSGGFAEVRLETLLADTRYPMRSGPFGSALLKSELQPEGIPFLGIDNVHVERFVPVYRRFVSDDKYRELARYTVYPGDVMVTIMGTVGRCCVVPPDVGTAISSKHVWTLTLDQDRYSPALLAWQFNHSPAVLGQLQGSAQGGIMRAISSGTLRDLLVPLPSPDEVQTIEGLLLSFNNQIAALEAELEAAKALKAALMSDLLSGRVRVPE
ncbi:restriction endonuclease subunit S [Sphingomonas sp. DT-207]|uniref:restriction endonuclease subunit S n=1 Tax=Sphingomonas sp. DT-207 TaxID=3396167 RepID=UPI003F1B4D72